MREHNLIRVKIMSRKTVFVFLYGAIVSIYASSCFANDEIGKTAMDVYSQYQLKPLDYSSVKISGDLKRQFDEVSDYYYNLSNDDLLKPYRERAGIAAPGKNMGGVYVEHGPFGQFLSGYARIYAATKDEKYKIKAVYLMEEWAKTIEPNGFFFSMKSPDLFFAYNYEKMLGGLLDIYYFCGDANSLKYLDKITDWEEKNIPKTKVYCDVVGKTGEWYTQSENLYRAYLYTGDKRYKDFAEACEYNEFWEEIFDEKYNEMYKKNSWHHAYSHTNSFNGLAGAYIVKGEKKYLDTLKKAYDFMQNEQCYATGGFGPNENLPPRKALIKSLGTTDNHFETQCGSWAGFKMTKYLVGFTGDAKYADWTEKLVINGIGASIPMSAAGNVFYYSSYRTSGAVKANYVAWPCCSGTRVEAVPDYYNLIYFYDSNSIYVSQFFASEGSFRMGNTSVKILQETKFPEDDTIKLTVSIDKASEFDIKFRMPKWLASKAAVEVNGKVYDYSVDNNWGVISKNWKNGDIIKLKLPMNFEISRIDNAKEYPAAIMYGPVVLAVKAFENVENPAFVIDLNNISKDFVCSATEPMTWKMRSNESIVLKPFYAYKEGERYFLYLDKSYIPIPAGSKEISVTLTNPQKNAGLLLSESDAETNNEPVVKAGCPAWAATKRSSHPAAFNRYMMYYVVDFPEFKNGKTPKVTFAVDYFDEGIGDFRILYDSNDGPWKEAGKFQLADNRIWKTYECTVNDAKFAGRCNGADIRFEIDSGNINPAVGMVKLTRYIANEEDASYTKVKSLKTSRYYVSSSTGSDDNNGLSPTRAWKTFSKINSGTFSAGDEIYLKRNDTWSQTLELQGSGTSEKSVVLDAYGDGNKPRIELGDSTKDTCVNAKDISYWTIRNLDMRNALRGMHLQYGLVKAYKVQISECDFYDMNYSTQDGKTVGIGLCIEGEGTDRFYDAVVRTCKFTRCVNGFAINIGTQNLICEDCFATGGLSAGFSLVNVRNSIIRRFAVTDVGGNLPYGTCAGFIVWSDGVIIDNCEFARCKNDGGHDGVGFDFEGNSKNITFTNNVIHDNAGAGIMVMSTSGHNSNILIKDCTLYNNCTSSYSEKSNYEMLCWNNGSTGLIENCTISKGKAADYIHPDFCNFTQTNNQFKTYQE